MQNYKMTSDSERLKKKPWNKKQQKSHWTANENDAQRNRRLEDKVKFHSNERTCWFSVCEWRINRKGELVVVSMTLEKLHKITKDAEQVKKKTCNKKQQKSHWVVSEKRDLKLKNNAMIMLLRNLGISEITIA